MFTKIWGFSSFIFIFRQFDSWYFQEKLISLVIKGYEISDLKWYLDFDRWVLILLSLIILGVINNLGKIYLNWITSNFHYHRRRNFMLKSWRKFRSFFNNNLDSQVFFKNWLCFVVENSIDPKLVITDVVVGVCLYLNCFILHIYPWWWVLTIHIFQWMKLFVATVIRQLSEVIKDI